jgi:hypothetical protein
MALRLIHLRFFRYSLRTLLVLVTVFCVWLGWQANIVHKRKAAIAEIEAGGGAIPLCANIGETLASPFITVEGQEVGEDGIDRKFSQGRYGCGRNGARP